MVELNQFYKCPVCGKIVRVVKVGTGKEIICCGKPMELMVPNTSDAAKEKHVPVVEKIDGGFKITVGSVIHPMDPDHYISRISFLGDDNTVHIKILKAGDKPEFIFKTDAAKGVALAYCNKHGLWKSQ